MRALVTGGAGFIGSHLTEALLARGESVRVVDSFTDYYDPALKRANLATAIAASPGAPSPVGGSGTCEPVEVDLCTGAIEPLLDQIDVVFHQAGQPGVRHSWAEGFAEYESRNILATQRLLEAVRHSDVQRMVYASSSSVYGDAIRYPTSEDDLPRPRSPYGVTKLAAEHLCGLYAHAWDVPVVSLRYFTVYGPRQRPDMAFHRLIRAALEGTQFPRYGDGRQVRDFTYVSDAVEANLLAAAADTEPGEVVNIAGGSSAVLSEVIDLVGELVGKPVALDVQPAQAGDVARTGGSIARARDLLGWEPVIDLRTGLTAQVSAFRRL